MKRVRFVKFTFTAEFNSENDCDALGQAAFGLRYGINDAKRVHLEVTGLGPLPLQPPMPIEEPTAVDQPKVAVDEPAAATPDNEIPF